MRTTLRRLAHALALVALIAPSVTRADVARPRSRVALRRQPDQASRVVERVAPGTKMLIVERSTDGVWLLVIIGDRRGWVLASDVEVTQEGAPPATAPAPQPPPKNEGEPPSPSPSPSPSSAPSPADAQAPSVTTEPAASEVHAPGWTSTASEGGEAASDLLVTRPVDLLDRPRESGTAVRSARAGERLRGSHMSRDQLFYMVELDGAHVAWVPVDAVAVAPPGEGEPGAPAEAPPAEEPPPVEAQPLPPRGKARRGRSRTVPASAARTGPVETAAEIEAALARRSGLHLYATGGFALAHLDQTFTSNAAGPLTNYGDRTGLAGVDLALGLDLQAGGGFFGGLAGAYRFAGMADVTAHEGGGATTLGIRTHDVEALGRFGYRARVLGGFSVSAHAGLRMLLDLVDKDYSVAIPSERLTALTVGLAVEAPRIVWRLGLAFGADYLPLGSRAETANLREGDDVGTSGYSFSLALTYALSHPLAIVLAGRYTSASTRFDGTAERDPAITTAERRTTFETLSLGVRYTH